MQLATIATAPTRLARLAGPAGAIVAVQLTLFPVPPGIWVRGLIVGGLTGLIAVGMALTYRTDWVVNFAHAELGTAPVVLAYLLMAAAGWPYAAAAGAGAAGALTLGALVDLTVIKRFRRAPRLVLTVATLGLAQLLTLVGVLLPRAFGMETLFDPRIAAPFTWNLTVGGVVLTANDLIATIVVPAAVVALGLFLRRSVIGIAARAAADDADRALGLGVPVARVRTAVWAVAGLLAFVAVFLRAGILGVPITAGLGFGILLRALAALVIGRLAELSTVFAVSVALGVLEIGVGWNSDSTALVDPVLALVIAVALVLRRSARGEHRRDEASAWRASDDPRPLPPAIARLGVVRLVRLVTIVVIGAAAVAAPLVLSVDRSLKASAVLVYALLGLSIVVLTGWTGQVSLGQIGFLALGANLGAKATLDWGLDLSVALGLTALAGAGAAVVVGLPALRLHGMHLAVVTLAFSIAATSYLLNPRFAIAGWVPRGRVERPPLFGRIAIDSATGIYYVTLAVLALALIGLRGIRASSAGRALLALRENPASAAAFGVHPARTRLTGFALAGALAATAGCLLAHHQQAVGQQPYEPAENLALFTMVVVGGVGSLAGAVVGAGLLQGMRWFLPREWQLLASGVGVLGILLLAPSGIGGLALRARDAAVHRLAVRHHLDAPGIRSGRLASPATAGLGTATPGTAADSVNARVPAEAS